MSPKKIKMLDVAINTESALFDNMRQNSTIKPWRLKEREVKHIRISDTDLRDSYSFGEQIGQGGFGTVISVIDKYTDKDWAMKVVSKTVVGEKLETIYREINILKMVDHPHIIYLDKVFESTTNIYLVLERCYEVLYSVYKQKKSFSEPDTRKIITDLTSAVWYLHKNDIVHRDLKLENILIAKNPDNTNDKLFIKLTDFGLSIVKQGSGHEYMLHDCCGTLVYMAPEIITSRSYSQQCDVWAVGVIMYTLLSGRYPFYSTKEQELTEMICNEEPLLSGLSASYGALHLIRKILVKNPALRITAAEMSQHPWIIGKPMTLDENSTDNVLDMMRLWRSELMLPVGDECDWVSSAKAIENTDFDERHIQEESHSDESSNDVATPRKQSMRLPIKNIRFDKVRNQNFQGKRMENIDVDKIQNRRGLPSIPPLPQSNANKRFGGNREHRASTENGVSPSNNKGRKTGVTK